MPGNSSPKKDIRNAIKKKKMHKTLDQSLNFFPDDNSSTSYEMDEVKFLVKYFWTFFSFVRSVSVFLLILFKLQSTDFNRVTRIKCKILKNKLEKKKIIFLEFKLNTDQIN